MILYLVRHAHAFWSPDEDRPLSAQGRLDAERLADRLALRPVDDLIASPYLRARQTVEPLALRLQLPLLLDERFRERALGDWSASSFEDAVSRTWRDFDFAYPCGESNNQAQARAIKGVKALMKRSVSGSWVIGTHGNLLALMLNHYDPGVGFDFWLQLTMPDVYELELTGGSEARYVRFWNAGA